LLKIFNLISRPSKRYKSFSTNFS